MSESDLSFIGRAFDQICFVVDDLEAATETWGRYFGITAWSVWEGLSVRQTEKTYWGEPGDFDFSVAYGFAGDVMIELARHDTGSSLYQDWLTEKGTGPHHIGFRVKDAAEYAAAEESFFASGLVKAMSGFMEGDGVGRNSCRWSYFDTRESLGCYAEIYYLDPELLESMERMKKGEVLPPPWG